MSKRAKYRIIKETDPLGGLPKYTVQERKFGSWGWWVTAWHYRKGPIFDNLDTAIEFVNHLYIGEKTQKVVYKI